MKLLKRILIFSIILVVILSIYVTYIERNLLITNKHEVLINKNGKENLKIVQFTDTHLGEYYKLEQLEKVVDKINSVEPDIVVFTGDLMDNASKYEQIDDISKVLSKIKCKIGKYAIYGNHDYGGGAVRYYNNIMKESGFKILRNERANLKYKNTNINIFGADDALMGHYNAKRTVEGIASTNVNILLLHEPDLIDDFKKYPVDLAISGHSHGGQVYVPFYGPITKTVLSKMYTKGCYNIENQRKTTLYVSSGIGNTKVPFRFLNVPEIVVYNLKMATTSLR